jgi:tRNA (guanine37-N1)-methyltransferase
MKRFDLITIFPQVVAPYVEVSILGRAQKEKRAKIVAHDLRKFSKDRHKKVDDSPYGGGAGMVMMVQPIDDAVRAVRLRKGWFQRAEPKVRVVMTSASGRRFTEADAVRLLSYDQVIFICGRYEGIDYRVEESVADESLSIGDYVLTGGELPALVMVDAITRLIPGVLGNAETLMEESHNAEGFLEYPQYTKPEIYRKQKERGGFEELPVPNVLLSGNHRNIAAWRKERAEHRGKE